MALWSLAIQSLRNRRQTALLTVLSIAVSVCLLLGVERVRHEVRDQFLQTVSGTDLVVGARSGSINLLLYTVFRIGDATNNISWSSYQEFAAHPQVSWTIPLSLGDSHRGYRVLGTSNAYFEHLRYGGGQALRIREGRTLEGLYDVVLGAEVARQLNYQLGDRIVVAHGGGKVSFVQHDDQPFTVVGILAPTGTPVDRTLHVSLEAIEAIHLGWHSGRQTHHVSAEQAAQMDLTPKTITGFLVGLKSKVATFQVQRQINEYRREPLTAIMPGVALQQLWSLIGVAENALLVVSALVVVSGLIGMMTNLLSSLNERRREMAILRSIGARPWQIAALLVSESLALTLAGLILGVVLLYGGWLVLSPWIESRFGLYVSVGLPGPGDWLLMGGVVLAGLLAGLVPAFKAYRQSLADGLTPRI